MATERREQIEHDVGSMDAGEIKTVEMVIMDAVTYRMYLAQYSTRACVKFKTKYDRGSKMLTIKRIV